MKKKRVFTISIIFVLTLAIAYTVALDSNIYSDKLSFSYSGVRKGIKKNSFVFEELLNENKNKCEKSRGKLLEKFSGPFTIEHEIFRPENKERLFAFLDDLLGQALSRSISSIIFDNFESQLRVGQIKEEEFIVNVQKLNICRDVEVLEIINTLFRASQFRSYSMDLRYKLGRKMLHSLVQEGGGGFYTYENMSFRVRFLKKLITYKFLPKSKVQDILELDEKLFQYNSSIKYGLKKQLELNKQLGMQLYDLSAELGNRAEEGLSL